jgi:hypothetical protein
VAKQFAVTGPYVTVKTMTVDGVKVIGLHRGAPVPQDVDPAHLQHLLDHDLVGEVGQVDLTDDMPAAQRAQLDANDAAHAGLLETSPAPSPAQQLAEEKKAEADKAAADKAASERAAGRQPARPAAQGKK